MARVEAVIDHRAAPVHNGQGDIVIHADGVVFLQLYILQKRGPVLKMRAHDIGDKTKRIQEHKAAVFAAVIVAVPAPAHGAGALPREDRAVFKRLL